MGGESSAPPRAQRATGEGRDIIQVIIPHFTNYPLQSTKFLSFYLFKAAANLMDKKLHLTLPGYKELLTYKAATKKGLEAKVFLAER